MLPNIVFVITDNQSPWTLGCYGNDEIRTPNIDTLSEQGVRFTNAFCSNPVCSPNRATLLTGLMPSQHGVHNWLGSEKPDAQMGPDAYCTIEEFVTLPQILANEGYACGMSGKWHLGDSMRPQLGFDYWYAKPKGHTTSFYGAEAIWQGRVIEEPGYYLDAITEHALDFLHQVRQQPFFLYLAYNAPYGLDDDLLRGHRNRHRDYYADKELSCFPRGEPHPWLLGRSNCVSNQTAMRSYAAAVSGVDDGVGSILTALDDLDVRDNTLVIFTADHGLCAGHHGWWGMSDHGRPLTMFDENLRVPLIWAHPGRITAGRTCDIMTCNYDFMPSVLDYLNLDQHAPESEHLPGRSYAPALVGNELDWGDAAVFHEYENTRSVRTAGWKYTRRVANGPNELYDMKNDPGERQNMIDQPAHADTQRDLNARLTAFYQRHVDPRYDLWHGGVSKAGRVTKES